MNKINHNGNELKLQRTTFIQSMPYLFLFSNKVGRTNRTSRSEGAVELIYHLERANPALLVPYVSSFIRFLGQLIEENNGNTKVMIHLLEVHSVLLESFLTPQSAQKQEHAIVQNLFEIGLDSKAQVLKNSI